MQFLEPLLARLVLFKLVHHLFNRGVHDQVAQPLGTRLPSKFPHFPVYLEHLVVKAPEHVLEFGALRGQAVRLDQVLEQQKGCVGHVHSLKVNFPHSSIGADHIP